MVETLRRAPRASKVVALALVALLSLAAVATAATFSGETQQGRNAKLRVDDVTNLPDRFVINWKTRDCNGRRTTYTGSTRFDGFKQVTEESFVGAGSYEVREGGGIVSTIRVRAEGKRKTARRWKGTFKANVRVERRGEPYDRCRLEQIRWTVDRDRAQMKLDREAAGYRR